MNNSDRWQCQSVFMDLFFSFLSSNKSVFSFKNRYRTGKTDDFSSPGAKCCQSISKVFRDTDLNNRVYSRVVANVKCMSNFDKQTYQRMEYWIPLSHHT